MTGQRQEAGARGRSGGIRLTPTLHDEMVAHCQREYPKEACGLLIADAAGAIVRVRPMHNVEQSPIGYSMDPTEQLRVEKELRTTGRRMVGIYHSHTASEAYPSSVDVSMAVSPDLSYVLVSLQDRQRPLVKSYRIDGTAIREEACVVGAAEGARHA